MLKFDNRPDNGKYHPFFCEISVRWTVILGCLVWLSGCSLLDRQQGPQILELRTDFGADPSVGRGRKVQITLVTDDPDNDELDFRWIATGGKFAGSNRDTLIDLFQDSVTVAWEAPAEVGIYDLLLEVSDGRSGKVETFALRVTVTQGPPAAHAGEDQFLAYSDTLRVVLDGLGSSDPDGDDLRYVWRQVGGPRVGFDASSSTPEFRAIAPADYIFELSVSDDLAPGVGDTSDVVTVRVRVSDRGGRGG